MTHQVKFSHNWNGKLDSKVFTTIRKWDYSKECYYKDLIGYSFDILLKGKKKCVAELQEVEIMEFSKIPTALLMVDTGLEEAEMKDVFGQFGLMQLPNNKAIILTFLQKCSLTRNSEGGENGNK